MYPCLKLLTGDAIFAQRPLLEAIQEYERDYLFCVKENQSSWQFHCREHHLNTSFVASFFADPPVNNKRHR